MTEELEVTEAKELPLVEEGDYRATVSRIEADKSGKYGTMVVFYFDIEGVEVPALASQSLNPKTKLYSWVHILTGKKLAVGSKLKFSDLTGKQALVTVRNRPVLDEKGQTQMRNGELLNTSTVVELRKIK